MVPNKSPILRQCTQMHGRAQTQSKEQTPKPSGIAMGMSKEIVEKLHQIDGGASKNHCKEPYCILEEHDQSVVHYDNLHDMVWRTPKEKV